MPTPKPCGVKMISIKSRIEAAPNVYTTLHALEFAFLKFETDTPRSVAWKKLVGRPDDATVVWFDNDCYGEFWVRDKTAYFAGYIPKFLYQVNHKCVPFTRDGFTANVGISPITNISEATVRFISMIAEYKERYKKSVLAKVRT